jgi:hypothetical protein
MGIFVPRGQWGGSGDDLFGFLNSKFGPFDIIGEITFKECENFDRTGYSCSDRGNPGNLFLPVLDTLIQKDLPYPGLWARPVLAL